jgi:hypothetical protein
MAEFRNMSTEQMRGAKMNDAAMLHMGAEIDERGQIIATERQEDEARREMELEFMAKDLVKYFSEEDLLEITNALDEYVHSKPKERPDGAEGNLERISADLYKVHEIVKSSEFRKRRTTKSDLLRE